MMGVGYRGCKRNLPRRGGCVLFLFGLLLAFTFALALAQQIPSVNCLPSLTPDCAVHGLCWDTVLDADASHYEVVVWDICSTGPDEFCDGPCECTGRIAGLVTHDPGRSQHGIMIGCLQSKGNWNDWDIPFDVGVRAIDFAGNVGNLSEGSWLPCAQWDEVDATSDPICTPNDCRHCVTTVLCNTLPGLEDVDYLCCTKYEPDASPCTVVTCPPPIGGRSIWPVDECRTKP